MANIFSFKLQWVHWEVKDDREGSGGGEMEDAVLAITIKLIHITGIFTCLKRKDSFHEELICWELYFVFPHVWKSQENPLYIRLLHSQNIRSQDVSVRVKCFCIFIFYQETFSLFVFLQSVTFNLDWIDVRESSGKCSGLCWLQQN